MSNNKSYRLSSELPYCVLFGKLLDISTKGFSCSNWLTVNAILLFHILGCSTFYPSDRRVLPMDLPPQDNRKTGSHMTNKNFGSVSRVAITIDYLTLSHSVCKYGLFATSFVMVHLILCIYFFLPPFLSPLPFLSASPDTSDSTFLRRSAKPVITFVNSFRVVLSS